MVTYVTVGANANVDEILNSIMDQYGDDAEELCQWLGKFQSVTIDVQIDQEDAIGELSDELVRKDYRERYDGVEIETEHEFIDAIKALKSGDTVIARGLFGRMFQSYPKFADELARVVA